METNLPKHIPVHPLDSARAFTGAAEWGTTSIGEYWRWAHSNIVGNTERGVLAQFIVAKALGDTRKAVDVWAPPDVLASDATRVEVKSAAYLQTWGQHNYSRVSFGVRETLDWNPETGEYGTQKGRYSDAYVFALLTERDKDKVDPLDLRQWEFYVVPTFVLNRELGNAKSISLVRLQKLIGPVGADGIKDALLNRLWPS